jgi:CheY-like chemotaxis protein
MPDSKVAKILVVDDQADNRDLLCSLLRIVGFEVRSASSGEEALAAVAIESFDLMLLDLRMPGMDGLEVIAHLRRQNLEPRLPIVIVSASALETEQTAAIDRGADGFLVKPVNDRDLFAMIERLVDIEYRRSDHEPVPSVGSTTSIKSPPSSALPAELVEALREAAQRGDIAAISSCLAEVIDRDQEFGERLKGLADQFNYEALIAELGAAE